MSHDLDLTSIEQLSRTELAKGALYRLDVAGSRKPTVLLVHGAGHGAWCYGAWMKHLAAAGYSSASIDSRGHGSVRVDATGAPRLALDDGVREYADDVIEAARLLPPRAILAGHSLGGLVVALAAMDLDLAGLALVTPSPPGNLPNAGSIPAVPDDRLTTVPGREEVVRRFLGGRDPGAAALDRYCAMLCPESPRAMNDRYRLRVPIDATRVRTKVLVMEAGRDDALRHPPGQDPAIAKMFGGEYVLLPDAAHCLMLGPDAAPSAATFIDWIERVIAR
jgi:pimeloyl-ACP methyl ester carboxylesterase